MTAKEEYILFSEQTPSLPLFLQPWWLDAVTQPDGKVWEVLLARNKSGEIEAVMPFVYGSKFGMRFAVTPQLTQYTGVWIIDKEGESATDRLSREKKLQNDIIRQLEALKLSFFDVKFPLTYTYWSPFYWAGYRQETHYTYRIEDLRDIEKVYNNVDNVKYQIIPAIRFILLLTFILSERAETLTRRGRNQKLAIVFARFSKYFFFYFFAGNISTYHFCFRIKESIAVGSWRK